MKRLIFSAFAFAQLSMFGAAIEYHKVPIQDQEKKPYVMQEYFEQQPKSGITNLFGLLS